MELTISAALKKGIEAHKAGRIHEADRFYTAILKAQPKQPDANHNLGVLAVGAGKIEQALRLFKVALDANPAVPQFWISYIDALIKLGKKSTAVSILNQAKAIDPDGISLKQLEDQLNELNIDYIKEPTQDVVEAIINLYNQGHFSQVVEQATRLLQKFSYSITLYNIKGAAHIEMGQYDQAENSYKQVLGIKHDCAEAYNNIGVALNKQGNFEAAIDNYKQALKINSNYAEAYNNMGVAFTEQGNFDSAICGYTKALEIKPDFIASYTKLYQLLIQLDNHGIFQIEQLIKDNTILTSLLSDDPQYQIFKSLSEFINGQFESCVLHLSRFKELISNGKICSSKKNQKFCNAYSIFLTKLCKKVLPTEVSFDCRNVYHIGESHCLSYAHNHLKIQGRQCLIVPLITFGGKAFHFSHGKKNRFKAITKWNLDSLPKHSTVLISFGEIDCRYEEGFIKAVNKTRDQLAELVKDTVSGYVSWFIRNNEMNHHEYWFFNLPAPVFDQNLTSERNLLVRDTVKLFNDFLQKKLKEKDIKLIDVYTNTCDKNCFSNSLYHCDSRHLDNSILPVIQKNFL